MFYWINLYLKCKYCLSLAFCCCHVYTMCCWTLVFFCFSLSFFLLPYWYKKTFFLLSDLHLIHTHFCIKSPSLFFTRKLELLTFWLPLWDHSCFKPWFSRMTVTLTLLCSWPSVDINIICDWWWSISWSISNIVLNLGDNGLIPCMLELSAAIPHA